MHITSLDPYNAYVDPNSEGVPILIKGSNILPLGDMVQC